MRTAVRTVLIAATALVGAVVLVLAAWAADTQRHNGRVARNVSVAGERVGGLPRARVAGVVARVAERYASAPVLVDAPGGGFVTDPAEIGLTVEVNTTVQAVMDVGRRGGPAERLRGWLGSLLGDRRAPVRVSVDAAAVHAVVAERDPARTPPVEPGIREVDGRLVAVKGKPGRGIDPRDVVKELPSAAAAGAPVTVEVERGDVPPRFTVADATRLAREGEAITATPLRVTVDDFGTSVRPERLRSWLRAEPGDAGLRLAVDGEKAAADLAELLPEAGTPPVETRFEVLGPGVRIVPGQPGTACCSPVAASRIERALRQRPSQPLLLPLRRADPKLSAEQAASWGIKEQVSTFTTSFKPNQPRVVNIHTISDIVRGQVIPPGGTFSVNGFVGKRTRAKGFVVDAVIEEGRYSESVGGGISQFATTAFNAAFFAGLEFEEYQSHSLYISRYPYGREATLSYPHPDLKIRNPSPHGVLIWPTYTPTSVTVSMYSTKWVDAAQTAQSKQQRGPCTRVRTERTRRFLADGTVKVDHVSALYRPDEGVKCP